MNDERSAERKPFRVHRSAFIVALRYHAGRAETDKELKTQ
jgi:hypothetical protein